MNWKLLQAFLKKADMRTNKHQHTVCTFMVPWARQLYCRACMYPAGIPGRSL